jgi:phosphodiesterase/alkaline phosphatase D-like protein
LPAVSPTTTQKTTAVAARVSVSNLAANTMYWYEFYATNSFGITSWGGVLTFATGAQ